MLHCVTEDGKVFPTQHVLGTKENIEWIDASTRLDV